MKRRRPAATQEQAKARFAELRPYVEAHVADYGGRWIEWEGDDRIPVLAFAVDVERHRAAIDPRVRVVAVPQPSVALHPLRRPAVAFTDAAAGVELSAEGIDIKRGCVLLRVLAVDRAAGLAFQEQVRARFGSLVQADVIADSLTSEEVTGFSAWHTDQSGRLLTVHWNGADPEQAPVLEVDERSDGIYVQVRARYTNHHDTNYGASMSASAELGEPRGKRRVFDATTGERRPNGHAPQRDC